MRFLSYEIIGDVFVTREILGLELDHYYLSIKAGYICYFYCYIGICVCHVIYNISEYGLVAELYTPSSVNIVQCIHFRF